MNESSHARSGDGCSFTPAHEPDGAAEWHGGGECGQVGRSVCVRAGSSGSGSGGESSDHVGCLRSSRDGGFPPAQEYYPQKTVGHLHFPVYSPQHSGYGDWAEPKQQWSTMPTMLAKGWKDE